MFVKKDNSKRNGKVYKYLDLVEGYRVNGKTKHKHLLRIGKNEFDDPKKVNQLTQCINDKLEGQENLFEDKYPADVETLAEDVVERYLAKYHDKEPDNYELTDPDSIKTTKIRSIGLEHVFNQYWHKLDLDNILKKSGLSQDDIDLSKVLVAGRLISPGSELHTYKWFKHVSGIKMLIPDCEKQSLSSLYRVSDHLYINKSEIESRLHKRENEIFDLEEDFCLFDLTNTYFEGLLSNNSKARHGRSKEKRNDCKLLSLGMIVDEDGFPKYSRTYPGNQYEPHTLFEMLDNLASHSRVESDKKQTILMDAGISTKDNLKQLRDNERYNTKYDYITVKRGSKDIAESEIENMEIIRDESDNKIEVIYRDTPDSEDQEIICRSSRRIKKDRGIRVRKEEMFLEQLEATRQGLDKPYCTKKYPKVLEKIGRLKEKYSQAAKYYEIEVVPEKNSRKKKKNLNAVDIRYSRKTALDDTERSEGCYILRTNRDDLDADKVWKYYMKLLEIERSFRTLKSSLGINPIYHSKEERCDGHIFIAVLAYYIEHAIRRQLKSKGCQDSWETIKVYLQQHQMVHREYDIFKDDNKHHVHEIDCSVPEQKHREIYQLLEIAPKPFKKIRKSTICGRERLLKPPDS
jgi:hypothetical protein